MAREASRIHDRRMTKHTRRPRAEYEALLNRKREERLTFAELSEESGVPACTLQYWAKKLRDPRPAAEDRDTTAFLQLGLSPATEAAIELLFPDDVRVAVRPGFDAATLRAVIDALAC